MNTRILKKKAISIFAVAFLVFYFNPSLVKSEPEYTTDNVIPVSTGDIAAAQALAEGAVAMAEATDPVDGVVPPHDGNGDGIPDAPPEDDPFYVPPPDPLDQPYDDADPYDPLNENPEDMNGNGVPDEVEDMNDNGIPDDWDDLIEDITPFPLPPRPVPPPGPPGDADGDGWPDWIDPSDSDGDGWPDCFDEKPRIPGSNPLDDADGDGWPDWIDPSDSDGDGWPDCFDAFPDNPNYY